MTSLLQALERSAGLRAAAQVALFLIISLPLLFLDFNPEEFRDLLAYLAAGRGQIIYRDFSWLYGPLTPYFYGLVLRLAGNPTHLLGLRLIFLGIGCLTLILGERVFSRMVRWPWAFLAALLLWPPFFPGQYTTNNALVISLSLAALNAFLNWWQEPSRAGIRRWGASAAWCAALVLVRPLAEGPLLVMAAMIYMFLDRRAIGYPAMAKFLCSLTAVVLAVYVGLYVCVQGSVNFWEKVLVPFYGLAYVNTGNFLGLNLSWLPALWPPSLHGWHVALRGFLENSQRLAILAAIAAGPAIWLWMRRPAGTQAMDFRVKAVLAFYLIAVCISFRMFFSGVVYNYLLVFPLVSLVLCAGLLAREKNWRQPLAWVWLAMLLWIVVQLPGRSYIDLARFRFFPEPAAAAGRTYQTADIRGLLASWPGKAAMVDQTVAYIQEHTRPQDEIYFFGYDPTYYALSRRPSIFPEDEYIAMSAGLNYSHAPEQKFKFVNFKSRSAWAQQILGRLEAKKPRLVLMAAEHFFPGVTDQNPVFAWIQTHYTLQTQFGYQSAYRDFKWQDQRQQISAWIKIYQFNGEESHAAGGTQ